MLQACPKTGGYFLRYSGLAGDSRLEQCILDWLEIHVWNNLLGDADFTVMSHPFFMCYATSRIQKTRSASFPQQSSLMALVASAPGLRPDRFSTDLSAPYALINCSHKRNFALIDEIDPPPHPLRKEGSRCRLVKNEKNVKLLCEVMMTFATVIGSVFDPFRHAMSTPCAAEVRKKVHNPASG